MTRMRTAGLVVINCMSLIHLNLTRGVFLEVLAFNELLRESDGVGNCICFLS